MVISIKVDNDDFRLMYHYDHDVDLNRNLSGLMGISAVINYALFTGKIELNFPTSETDLEFIKEMIQINNREVFINRLCRIRYPFFKEEYLPQNDEINEMNSNGDTQLVPLESCVNHYETGARAFPAILSSGGKESLLTFGLLREIDSGSIAYYFNESGGHWKAAKHSHEKMKGVFRTAKVWSNVDRFYGWMNRKMKILDPEIAFRWADDYPVQLFLFPVYLIAMLPSIRSLGIQSFVMGNELDDPLEEPTYQGMRHYYGVYDQSPDFQKRFSRFLADKGFGIALWSALYNIYGSVVENILVNRYPELFKLQRSCHSCYYGVGDVIPCGKCSKCLGVRLFIEYSKGDPGEINYPGRDSLYEQVKNERMKLDPDELSFLMNGLNSGKYESGTQIEGVHLLENENEPFQEIPGEYRAVLKKIIEEYTNGDWKMSDGKWKLIVN